MAATVMTAEFDTTQDHSSLEKYSEACVIENYENCDSLV